MTWRRPEGGQQVALGWPGGSPGVAGDGTWVTWGWSENDPEAAERRSASCSPRALAAGGGFLRFSGPPAPRISPALSREPLRGRGRSGLARMAQVPATPGARPRAFRRPRRASLGKARPPRAGSCVCRCPVLCSHVFRFPGWRRAAVGAPPARKPQNEGWLRLGVGEGAPPVQLSRRKRAACPLARAPGRGGGVLAGPVCSPLLRGPARGPSLLVSCANARNRVVPGGSRLRLDSRT